MIDIIIPIVLIVIGIVIVLLRNKMKPNSTKTVTATPDKKSESAPVIKTRSIPLEELVIPGNFPSELVFYFGSQTGTAEKFCGYLQEEANKIGISQTKVIDFEEFKPDVFAQHELVIICVSTHYEGDPCDNTKKFYKWLKEQRRIKET